MAKRNKFNNDICNDCYYYWSNEHNVPVCHKQGKKIYDGECIEYKPSLTLTDKEEEYMINDIQTTYERYMEEWN